MIAKVLIAVLLAAFLAPLGCQNTNMVKVREPGTRLFNDPIDAGTTAKTSWEYAALSEIVYDKSYTQTYENCPPPPSRPPLIDSTDWTEWEDFPSADLQAKANDSGLHVEVWESAAASTVVLAFRGTEKSILDWISNLRWLIPFRKDQYTLVAQEVGREFVERFALRPLADRQGIEIIATGHSLGGGLAQHLAYSLPGSASQIRVSKVYAFDPSPVTGWFSIDNKTQRDANATGLEIDRVFEHGEVIAYLRLLLSYVSPPSGEDPSVREVRYNSIPTWNPMKNHSMIGLACFMKHAALPSGGSSSSSVATVSD